MNRRRARWGLLLWTALLGAMALWVTRDILPTREGAPAGWAALGQGVLAGRDTLTHDYPAFWWGWEQVRSSGKLPLWNPSWFSGIPFIASQTFMPFYPLNWLGGVLPFPLAFNVQYPLHLALAALVMLLTLRARGLGWWAAGLGGLAWGFGGHLATLAGPGHIQKLQTLTWLPLVAWSLRECARARHDPTRIRPAALALAGGLAMQVTAGHAQILYLSLLAGLAEACVAFFARRTTLRPGAEDFALSQDANEFNVDATGPGASGGRGWVRPLRAALVGGLLAMGLAAVFWVPSAEFARLSNRQVSLTWDDATRGSLPPEEAFEFVLPRPRGDSMPGGRGPYVGRYGESSTSSPERIVSDYAGAVTLALALFALLAGGPRRRAAAGYLALGGAFLMLAMGRYLPTLGGSQSAYALAMKVVPGLAHLRSPSTMMALVTYALASMAALGAESLLAPTRPQLGGTLAWRPRVYGLAALFLACVVLRLHGTRLFAEPYPGAEARSVLPGWFFIQAAHHLLQTAVPALGLMLAFNVVQFFMGDARLKRVVTGVLVAALPLLAAGDLVGNARPFWNAEPVAPYREFLTSFWAQPHWAREDAPIRYYEYGNELSNRALTLSNYAALHQVATISGYHPVVYEAYFDLLRKLGFATDKPHPNLFRLLGVNYLVWPAAGGPPVPEGFFEIARQGPKRLLYNPEIRYVRAVRHIEVVPDQAAALDRLAGDKFNAYESTTVLEDDAKDAVKPRKGPQPEMNLQTRILPRGPGEIELRCSTSHAGPAVISEPAIPGWKLLHQSGFRETNYVIADGYFKAIYIPYGRNLRLLLHYDPVSQRLGLYLTCLSLGVCGWIWGRGAVEARKSRITNFKLRSPS